MPDIPNRTLAEFLRGNIDLENDTLRIALFDDSTAFTFDPDTHEFVGDVLDGGTTAQELQGSAGYTGTADRQTLTTVTVTEDNTDDEGVFDADDVTWTAVESTADIQGWIVYVQVGGDDSTPADDPIIQVEDDDLANAASNLPLTTDGSDVKIEWAGEGIINGLTP
ncbi:hypothetical protein OSG_eHP27_00065 [environmental Halophage eHP-27]|nr:hypothetical protein OSG_eHP27_00065 [environmental Halophage eHP-27]